MRDQVIQHTEPKASLTVLRALCMGGVAALPTDTLYGLHGLATHPGMARRLGELKGYAEGDRGFILLVEKVARIERYAHLQEEERAFIEKHCPGPVSFILEPLSDTPSSWMTEREGQRRIAFRIPDYPFLLTLIELLDAPLLSTSANLAGEPPLENVSEIVSIFGDRLDVIVSDAELEKRVEKEGVHPSALVDLTIRPPKLLREGRDPFDFSMEASTG